MTEKQPLAETFVECTARFAEKLERMKPAGEPDNGPGASVATVTAALADYKRNPSPELDAMLNEHYVLDVSGLFPGRKPQP